MRFDLPLLERELRECGFDLLPEQRRVVDVMTIFHRKNPRNLSAAVRFYLDRDHSNAHAAEADVAATFDVLEAQLEHHDDLPRTIAELDAPGNCISYYTQGGGAVHGDCYEYSGKV